MNSGPCPNSGNPGLERTVAQHESGPSSFCTSCGARLEEASLSPVCPICLARFRLPVVSGHSQGRAGKEPGDSAPKSKGLAAPAGLGNHLFAHYELEIGLDGTPLKLGHG